VTHLVEVSFKGNRKEFFLWDGEAPPPLTASVVVEADRGEDVGRVHAIGALAEKRSRGVVHGPGEAGPARWVRRLATAEDVRRLQELRTQDEDARRKAMERVKANALVMKVTDAEWQWDRKKLTLYFTAEKRVDFRQLVRELAAMFRTRIELKQIGVRDEAKRLDGIGRCGRQYCSASWLPEFRPVNLGVAKDQRLSLNPSQISGACGRLMCSLRYEHDFYVAARKRFPKEGRLVRTARGEEKVLANDIFRDRVTLRGSDGETRVLPLAELRRELEELGAPDAAPPDARAEERAEADQEPGETAVVSAPAATVDVSGSPDSVEPPARDLDEDVEDDEGAPDADEAPSATRPPRRRGRRGGRRNRPGGNRRPDGDPGAGGPPPASLPDAH